MSDEAGDRTLRVRPYALTGGRTRSHHDLPIEAIVKSTLRGLSPVSGVNRLNFQTLGGISRAESVLIPALRVGSATWFDETAVVLPRPAGYPPTVDGLMPLHRFVKWLVDDC